MFISAPRSTHIDYWSLFALDSKDIDILHKLGLKVKNRLEFQTILVSPIWTLQNYLSLPNLYSTKATKYSDKKKIWTPLILAFSDFMDPKSICDNSLSSVNISISEEFFLFTHSTDTKDFDLQVENIIAGFHKEIETKNVGLNYKGIMTVFASFLRCSIMDLDETMVKIFDLTIIRKHEWESIQVTINSPKKDHTGNR